MTAEEYNSILSIIRTKTIKKGYPSIEAEEIISQAYVEYGNVLYDHKEFLQKCKIVLIEAIRRIQYTDKKVPDSGEKICIHCKETVPVYNFGIVVVRRYNGEYYNSYCKECARKRQKDYYQTIKSDPDKYKDWLLKVNLYKKEWRKRKKQMADNVVVNHKTFDSTLQ